MTPALLSRVWQKRNLLAALETLCIMAIAARAAFASEPAALKVDALTLSRHIDQAIAKRLETEKIKPSPVADDAEFLRRVYLDITGVIPTADAAAAFLDSKDPSKRAKLIEELLSSSGYGRHMADIWKSYL